MSWESIRNWGGELHPSPYIGVKELLLDHCFGWLITYTEFCYICKPYNYMNRCIHRFEQNLEKILVGWWRDKCSGFVNLRHIDDKSKCRMLGITL